MSQGTILLVEDDADEAYLATTALQSSGAADVVHVRDGAAALEFLFNGTTRPVVVLLDLKLPKLGGLEVLKAVRSDPKTRTIPVVVLTNSLAEEDVTTAYANGCNSYIRKQVNWTEFKEAMRQIGHYWVALNQGIRKPVA
jgi:CheY-like chemotaxis protein